MSRPTLALAGLALTASLLACGCASSRIHVSGAADARTVTAFDRLKSLAGEWESVDEKGNRTVASIFSVSSNGSAVREIMFPGATHEMTNMYHLDGSSIIATHYCAMGNQPRMRCVESDGTTFVFVFESITNLASKDVDPMASMTLTIHDANRISQRWNTLKVDAKHAPVFELTRKR